MSDQHHNEEHQHITPYRDLVHVLVALLVFTIATVAIINFDLGAFAVGMALVVASIKAYIVLAYFMHLKFDVPLFKYLVGIVMFVFIAFMVLTFFDYVNR